MATNVYGAGGEHWPEASGGTAAGHGVETGALVELLQELSGHAPVDELGRVAVGTNAGAGSPVSERPKVTGLHTSGSAVQLFWLVPGTVTFNSANLSRQAL